MTRCPVCDGLSILIGEITKEDLGQTHAGKYFSCLNCKSIFIADKKADIKYYNEEYAEKFKQLSIDGKSADLSALRLDKIKKRRADFKSILDFGSGTGDFLGYVRKTTSAECTGIEINQYARDFALKTFSGIDFFVSLQEAQDKVFDVITLFDVIEHFENPKEILQNLVKMLACNGLLVISTPYICAKSCKAELEKWKHCRPAEHFTHITFDGFHELFDFLKLDLIYFGFPEDKIRTPDKNSLNNCNILTIIAQKRGLYDKPS